MKRKSDKEDNKPFSKFYKKKEVNDYSEDSFKEVTPQKEFKPKSENKPHHKKNPTKGFSDKGKNTKESKSKIEEKPFSKFYKKNPAKEFFEEDFDKDYIPPTTDKEGKKFTKKDKGKFSKKKKFESSKKFVKYGDLPDNFVGKNEAPSSHDAPSEDDMRLNKYIAHAGICSRRKAGEHIQNGDVKVNDEVVREMGYKVQETDVVKFKGEIVTPTKNHVYILFNKPKNVITTMEDENGRKTVMDFVGDITKERVYPVGRLDRNTTGLLLLTNDGQFAQKLSHPSFEVKKVYKAKLDKPLTEEHMDMIRNTLTLEDGPAPIVAIEYGDEDDIIGIELHIGKNRIVRRIFEHLGYEVLKLDRVFYGGLTKKDLPVGKCRFLTKQELIILKHLV